MTVLLTEATNSAVLDNGSTSTVAGKDWVDCKIDSLNDGEKSQVVHKKSDTVFKLGDGERLTSLGKVVLPCYLA